MLRQLLDIDAWETTNLSQLTSTLDIAAWKDIKQQCRIIYEA